RDGSGRAGAGAGPLWPRRACRARGGDLRGGAAAAGSRRAGRVTIRQIVSCRGWSSGAYWATGGSGGLEGGCNGGARVCIRRPPERDVLPVPRGKEPWLAALANRLSGVRRPIVRTRHIVQPVRPHTLNRWLYNQATDLVVTVTEAIRLQLVAAGLGAADRVVALPGGVGADGVHA